VAEKASPSSITSRPALPLSKALALAKETVGSLKFAQASIVRWLASVSDPLRFGARGIDGVLLGQMLKGMTRKQAEAEALRDLFGPGKFSIEWEEDWVRKQVGVFVFTAYGFWVDADDFEARLSALLQPPPSSTETVVAEAVKPDEMELKEAASKDVASDNAEPEHVKYGMPTPRSPEQKAIQAFVIKTYGSEWRAVTLGAITDTAHKDAEFRKLVFPFPERSTWRRALGRKKN
jgi:hypothetical protein